MTTLPPIDLPSLLGRPTPEFPGLAKISTEVLQTYLDNWEFLAAYDAAWVDFFTLEIARRKVGE